MGKDSSLNGLQVNHPGTEETKAITESIPIPKTKNATTKENTSTCFTIDLLVTFLDTLVCFTCFATSKQFYQITMPRPKVVPFKGNCGLHIIGRLGNCDVIR